MQIRYHASTIRHNATMAGILLVILCNFFGNGQYISLWFKRNFYIGVNSRAACFCSNQLAVFYDFHQFVIIAFDGCLAWSHIIVQTCRFDISNDFVYDTNDFIFICD